MNPSLLLPNFIDKTMDGSIIPHESKAGLLKVDEEVWRVFKVVGWMVYIERS
jgi:hypothetical protein